MSPQSTIPWVAASQSEIQFIPPGEVLHSSADVWSDFAVEHIVNVGDPKVTSELPLGYLLRHLLVVPLRAQRVDLHWPGGASFSGTIMPDTLMVLPAHQPYTVRWEGGNGIVLQISPVLAAAAVTHDDDHAGDLEPVFAREDPFVTHAIHTLHNLPQLRRASSRVCGETLAMAVAAHVVKEYGVQRLRIAEPPAPFDPGALHRIDRFIDQRLDSRVTVDDLATFVGMAVFRFSRLFKLATGRPPYQYIRHKRIERAKTILAEQSGSISDVAYLCGFASQSHFTDVFRRITGVTPGRFATVARRGRKLLTVGARR